MKEFLKHFWPIFLVQALLYLMFFIAFSYATHSRADDLVPSCKSALGACDQDVQRLKKQVTGLKDDVTFYKKKAVNAVEREESCAISLATGAAAGALGGAAANGKTGLAPGGIVGTLIGTIVCVLGR
jgi:hypothetical protein